MTDPTDDHPTPPTIRMDRVRMGHVVRMGHQVRMGHRIRMGGDHVDRGRVLVDQ